MGIVSTPPTKPFSYVNSRVGDAPAAAGEGGASERGKDGAGSSLHTVATGAEGTGSVGGRVHVFGTGAEGMDLAECGKG